MDFDQRNFEWERFLQLKADLVTSFAQQTACRVCHCLELLKLSVCPESCHAESPEERELVVHKLVEGVLDEDLFDLLKDELLRHDHSLQASVSNARRLSAFETDLARLQSNIENYDISGQTSRLKTIAESPENIQSSVLTELTMRLSVLEARIKSYEDSLEALHIENSELRVQLRQGQTDELQKSCAKFSAEITKLSEENANLRAALENVSRQVDENAAQILQMKKERTELKEEEVDALMQKVSKQKATLLEEVRKLNESTERRLEQVNSQHEHAYTRLKETDDTIERLTKDQRDLKEWQREVKNLSSHARNLQQAADSVFSSQQKFRDFQHIISQSLEELRREVEILKTGRISQLEARQDTLLRSNEEYQIDILELRKQSKQVAKQLGSIAEAKEELAHRGKFEFSAELGVACWSCCKTSRESKGCVKRGA